ncbi:Translation machinery-associated protein 16 like [Verticillium longisporum]|uniref:Translation machinery-associated protein 16 like n=1 Tax=Verticillium longisporum TaxID=100787 RepID=A0A0G4M8D4_VERLO|nr:Translation machinery-associated protein 16 like [Verticillium longisporum]KAG7141332.1 Translation machinery-associated protein 16 like [Verticillium longisporum]CRK30225.1 hypothetical protein BN1708_015791 [Verticillium longisporum]
MAKTLEKTRKQIAKKRNGTVEALHLYSRDSKRLHRASVRDEKLGKLASSRGKKEQPLLDRANFFRDAAMERGTKPLEMGVVQELINSFVHQHDEEHSEVKKTRRPGRPASARQDLLEAKIKKLLEEQKNGFFMPDLTSDDNVHLLDRWEGSWAYLTSVAWVRVASDKTVKPASFPPM